jgi:bisphosphoglycerate-independent phosphoglycerate mutase (AlkP superfamily)
VNRYFLHFYLSKACRLWFLLLNTAVKSAPYTFAAFLYVYRGDDLEASRIQQKIQALEERAEELDKLRTSTISSISYINDRNRKKNVEEAEKAIMVH